MHSKFSTPSVPLILGGAEGVPRFYTPTLGGAVEVPTSTMGCTSSAVPLLHHQLKVVRKGCLYRGGGAL